MPNNKYGCSQMELYTAARLGYESYGQHLADFADFKARYTRKWMDDRLAEVTAAEQMPDAQSRNAVSESLRIQLELSAEAARNLWQRLKRYIASAWTPDFQKPNLEAAGSDYYEKASQQNWESVKSLMLSGSRFIATNLEKLMANENMPATFQTRFEDARIEFDGLYQRYLNAQEDDTILTDQKIEANNLVYTTLISMFLDGQEIFKKEEAIKRQFIFSEILSKIGGAGTAGIRGLVTDAETGLPIAAVNITFQGSTKTALTNNEGRYESGRIAAGKYNTLFGKEGYQTLTVDAFEVSVGVTSTLNATLTPST